MCVFQAHAYLMNAGLRKHALSMLALAHKHMYGLDHVPKDVNIAYCKYIHYWTNDSRRCLMKSRWDRVLCEFVKRLILLSGLRRETCV